MIYKAFGPEGAETVMLLHGGGLSWWNYREAAKLLQDEYHVILPILDGHAGSERPFTTIESNAEEIIAFIDEHLGGKVLMIGGLSLGAQILLEMLAQRSDICRFALVESAMVVPSPLTHALIGPAFGSSYGLIRNRNFAQLQFRSLRLKPALFEDYYRDTCRISRSDMIAFMKANTAYSLKDSLSQCTAKVHVCAGEKENRGILRSAEMIIRKVPGSVLTVLPGLYHGEFSANHPRDYVSTIRNIIK